MLLYDDSVAYREQPSKPTIIVPLKAVESVEENLNKQHLHMDNDENTAEYINQTFALRLKKDFASLWLHDKY